MQRLQPCPRVNFFNAINDNALSSKGRSVRDERRQLNCSSLPSASDSELCKMLLRGAIISSTMLRGYDNPLWTTLSIRNLKGELKKDL